MFSSSRYPINCIHIMCKRYAGHSKWQNIRHTKAAKDTEKTQLYIRLGQRIKLAVQEGGNSDPAFNSKLSQAVETAKRKYMPTNTIQSYINQATKGVTSTKVMWYELKGPRGSFFIIQALTDNNKRIKDFIINICKKHSLNLENNIRNQFIHKGIIVAIPKSDMTNTEEYFVEHAIECGAEDVEQIPEDNRIKFFSHPEQVKGVANKLEKLGYEIEDADEYYLPINTVSLDDDILDSLSKAVEKFYALPEVVKVYDNIA